MDDHDLWMAFFDDPDGHTPCRDAGSPKGLRSTYKLTGIIHNPGG
jgi:hypothetical protein